MEKEQLLRTIRECDGNMSRVAQQLGVSRNTLYRRCKRLGIPPQHPRGTLL
jgi:transcriptional regulator of acetoin/glycerol metabolism